VDVGGQRNERKKWKDHFRTVDALIFVAAISEYDQLLFEDNKTNRLLEALNLFSEICKSHWFNDAKVILFLNKWDLFEDKLAKVDLNVCFSECPARMTSNAAVDYITSKFTEKATTQSVHTFVTTATDAQSVQKVFNTVIELIRDDLSAARQNSTTIQQ